MSHTLQKRPFYVHHKGEGADLFGGVAGFKYYAF